MALRKDGSGEHSEKSFPSSEQVVASRAGDVLIKNTLLKADHFPGCQNLKLTPLLDGAPNFRQVEGLPVYGVAIPTVRGLRSVMDAIGAAQGQRRVLWHNMREEPVLYINGKPYVVREADQPFCNVEYTGIDRSRVEDMESRLKRDVLREAARYGNHILVTEEDDDMNVIDCWEPVTESDVQTPLEVYAELTEDGYDVDYTRVPITDEKAPKDSDFEQLIQRLWHVPLDAALVFNCQMGRGRTTTGMIIATLVVLRRLGAFPAGAKPVTAAPLGSRGSKQLNGNGLACLPACSSDGGAHNNACLPTAANGSGCSDAGAGVVATPPVPQWFLNSKAMRGSGGGGGSPNKPLSHDAKLKQGMYGVVRSLLRVLERGVLGKGIVDAVIDACSAMQNLREAIATYRGRFMAESKESRRATLMGVCLEYLERYYMLLAFGSYLTWPKFDPASPGHVTFQEWIDGRPELRSVLSRMLRRNPLSALELHIPAATLPPGSAEQGSDDDAEQAAISQAEARADVIIEARGGSVLGALTILKEDYFPGMKSARLPQLLPGAGNFRRMAGLPVYGVAMCTLQGIRNVLHEVTRTAQAGAAPGSKPLQVLWFNMREEPVVYVNGLPFVLREQQRPMKNLQEYAGIDAERLERMEARLKQDVLAEAEQHGGRILVARESAAAPGASSDALNNSGTGELIDMWEAVSGPGAVQTPAEVYASLAAEGFPVRYLRVPVTDGRAPQACDIDAIAQQVRDAGCASPMVFNCQMGAGRTTTGTVIGGLLATYGLDAAAAGDGAAAAAAASAAAAAAAAAAAVSGGGGGVSGGGARAVLLRSAASTTSLDEASQEVLREEMAGDSPRHSEDEPDEGPPLALRGTSVSDLWNELSQEEMQERVSLAGGGYVGVRRVVRLLEHGDNAKRLVDAAIDANAQLLNLRIAIMRYRRPKHSYANHKSEVSARHSSFTRGSAYLERYCLLIAFGAFLEAGGSTPGRRFQDWLRDRPELQQALDSIHTNPATALAPVPVAAVPVLYRSVRGSDQVTPAEQEEVLKKRRGKTLNRRIILKSYLARTAVPSLPPGTPDVRQATGLPVFAVGNVPVDGLARLLAHLGAGPGGSSHVVVTDAREELVVYVNGVPYIRRELEMPAAALHHAGVHARQLEALEAALREDVAHEAAKWGGRVLLHQEIMAPATAAADGVRRGSGAAGGSSTPGGGLAQIQVAVSGPRAGSISSLLPAPMVASFLTPPAGPLPLAALQLAAAAAGMAPAALAAAAGGGGGLQAGRSTSGQLPPLSPMTAAGTGGGAAAGAGASGAGAPSPAPAAADGAFPGFRPVSPSPAANAAAAAAAAAATAGLSLGGGRSSSSQVVCGPGVPACNADGDCITAPVDVRPGAAVVPFWEPVNLQAGGSSSSNAPAAAAGNTSSSAGDDDGASSASTHVLLPDGTAIVPLATCLDVARQLQAAGFHITYRRIPLSRERTPVPQDMSDLMKQMLALPAGVGPADAGASVGGASAGAAAMMRQAEALAAAGVVGGSGGFWGASGGSSGPGSAVPNQQQQQDETQQQAPRSIVHLVVSRTATGSSARFAAAAFATFLTEHSASESKAAAAGAPSHPLPALPPPTTTATTQSSPALADGSAPAAKRMRRTMSDLGEYRGIMSVVRLLPGGTEVKAAVDESLDRCAPVGHLRQDIQACKHSAEAGPGWSAEEPGSTAWAARQLGVHYLKRYFLLIAFRCYLVQRQRAEQLGRQMPDFTAWVEDRRELGHLLSHLNLDT